MGAVAVAAAREVGYRGAGTVEFLLERDGSFWFIEMNTRLQVEHPLTEALVGVDLVEWQLRVAAGEALPLTQDEVLARYEAGGHAIEARLCAEDPAHGYLPQAGRIVRWSAPPGVRCDHALAGGSTVSAFYDSMLAKLIAHAPTRALAAERLAGALDRTVCLGVATNRAFLARILRDDGFRGDGVDTGLLAQRFPDDAARASAAPGWLEALAAAALALLPRQHLAPAWAGWSSSPVVDRDVPLAVDGVSRLWRLRGSRDALTASGPAGSHRIAALALRRGNADGGEVDAIVDGRALRATFAQQDDAAWWLADGSEIAVVDERLRSRAAAGASASGDLLAPMHGRITQVLVAPGACVAAGALLVVLEAMKIEHQIRAPRAGVIAALHARAGEQVAARQRLVEMAA